MSALSDRRFMASIASENVVPTARTIVGAFVVITPAAAPLSSPSAAVAPSHVPVPPAFPPHMSKRIRRPRPTPYTASWPHTTTLLSIFLEEGGIASLWGLELAGILRRSLGKCV